MKGEPIVILLVEDDPAHAEIVQRNLGGSRVANRLIHVADGQAALDYLNRENGFSDPAAAPRPIMTGCRPTRTRTPRSDAAPATTTRSNSPRSPTRRASGTELATTVS